MRRVPVVSVATVTVGLAMWLEENGFGTYRPDTPYEDGERAITIRRLPAHPDNAVTVTPYDVRDNQMLTPDTVIGVQLRFRSEAGDMTGADRWADEVAEMLHMKQNIQLPNGARISRARRNIVAPFGPDENNRPERADSYQLLMMLPTKH